MWKELVSRLVADYQFRPPASAAEIGAIDGQCGLGLIWSTETMISQNEAMRSTEGFRQLYMPFDCLFFFGDTHP